MTGKYTPDSIRTGHMIVNNGEVLWVSGITDTREQDGRFRLYLSKFSARQRGDGYYPSMVRIDGTTHDMFDRADVYVETADKIWVANVLIRLPKGHPVRRELVRHEVEMHKLAVKFGA